MTQRGTVAYVRCCVTAFFARHMQGQSGREAETYEAETYNETARQKRRLALEARNLFEYSLCQDHAH
jgi:hypothetical protein